MADSSEYRLLETDNFRRDLEKLGIAGRRIRGVLETRVYPVLKASPRQVPTASRLRGWDTPTWRIRIGSWRVFCEIDDEERIVFLTAANHRREAYR